MPRPKDPIARPELDVFYILDTSGSMRGDSITCLNRAMEATLDALRIEAKANADARVKVAVMEFNSNWRWVTSAGPQDLDAFFWDDLEAGGNTFVGSALKELNSKLHDHQGGFIDSSSGSLMPVIIFMTDGYAVDEYETALNSIRQNKWFSLATRIGFAIGDNPNTLMIAELAGTSEAVIRTKDLGVFAELLRWVSVTSSVLSSKTRTKGPVNRGAESVYMAKEKAGMRPDEYGIDIVYVETPPRNTGSSYGGIGNSKDEWDLSNPF